MAQGDFKVCDIDVRIYKRSDRRVSVERFAATELFFRFLQITIADVFTDGVTENEIERGLNAHTFCGRADNDGELDFEVGYKVIKFGD